MRTDTITLVRKDPFSYQILDGVTLQRERKTTVSDNGVYTADVINCYIDSISVDVQIGDLLIEGAHEFDSSLSRRELLQKIEKSGGHTINSVVDYTNRPGLPHFELSCEV